ncbi:hypothetical protein [Pontibacillus salipaludis]|uniref:hypothetical protein n=1 Tax=Pontibacillus salipaludis TaxID=1697394 RepID=UPI0031EFAD64
MWFMILFTFLVLFALTSSFNILLKTTEKKHWVISFFLSVGLSVIFTVGLAG